MMTMENVSHAIKIALVVPDLEPILALHARLPKMNLFVFLHVQMESMIIMVNVKYVMQLVRMFVQVLGLTLVKLAYKELMMIMAHARSAMKIVLGVVQVQQIILVLMGVSLATTLKMTLFV